MVITDKNGTKVKRSDTPSICNVPYKLVLTATAGSLSTQYGDPSSSALPAGYGSNFPTTGANGLYFDLEIAGSATTLTWDPVSINGITATMSSPTPTSVRVTFTGPTTATPLDPFATTGSTFELEGKSGGTTVAKYGFTIKKWYVNRGNTTDTAADQNTWCIGLGYRQAKVEDLTNASGTAAGAGGTIPRSTPGSGGNYYSRIIGGGLFSEWGSMGAYNETSSGFINSNYRTSDVVDGKAMQVFGAEGNVRSWGGEGSPGYGVCTHP